jgi:hypothetical protein
MFSRTTAALGAIVLALFGTGLAMIPDHRSWALVCFTAAGGLGLVVLCLTAISEWHFRRVRDSLGKLLAELDELKNRSVVDEKQYATWKGDVDDWFRQTQRFLAEKLPSTHAAMFRNLSEGGRYSVRGFNSEHAELMNSLRVYTNNLKSIIDRYLTTRS